MMMTMNEDGGRRLRRKGMKEIGRKKTPDVIHNNDLIIMCEMFPLVTDLKG